LQLCFFITRYVVLLATRRQVEIAILESLAFRYAKIYKQKAFNPPSAD
jgi:hypothetical protein